MKRIHLIILLFSSSFCIGQTKRCSTDYDSLLAKRTVEFPDKFPVFEGGEEGLLKFLKSSISPIVTGTSLKKIIFIIDTIGQVRNVCILSDLIRNELSEKEIKIINVVKTMPNWTPAISENKKVPVLFALPLNTGHK